MIEIYPNLFIGSMIDYESNVKYQEGWYVVHACKEPYHRKELGYTGRGAPKNNPEYLFARRGNRLILNLVDAESPEYIPKQIIDAALMFIDIGLVHKVLVHCNKGESRAPSIGLLYLKTVDSEYNIPFEEAEAKFRLIYPDYSPGVGIRSFMRANWKGEIKCGP